MHHFKVGIYAFRNVCVKDIDSMASMVLQNYQKFIVLTSKMIYIVALGVGFKCPRKIHLNTQWGGGGSQDVHVDKVLKVEQKKHDK